MKVLITGASGFIGGFLVEEALRRGYDTWAGIRAGSSRARLQDPRLKFIDLAYGDAERLEEQLARFVRENGPWDYIIHNAGITKTLCKADFFRVNAENTRRFLEALARSGCAPRKFLLMSSLSALGKGDETTFRPLRADDLPAPDTVYGQSKWQAEKYVTGQRAFPYVILRPTGVYGPGEKDYFLEIKSVAGGLDVAVGFTPQRITFIYVKDLARAAFLALEKAGVENRTYLVADGDVYTDSAFARMIQEVLGKKRVVHARLPLVLARAACYCSEGFSRLTGRPTALNTDKYHILKQRNWICDITPLREELGFTAEYPLRRGLEECITWYRQAGWL